MAFCLPQLPSSSSQVWMWQEEGFGLGLDVVMKEGYAGLIGASQPVFKGTPNTLKAYPMSQVARSGNKEPPPPPED